MNAELDPAFDQQTLDLYTSQASVYAEYSRSSKRSSHLRRMINRLPANGRVLDFGCGTGWDSAEFKNAGFHVTAIDGSSGQVEEANRLHGIGAVVMTFDQFDMPDTFDGVWASFSLQHVPRSHLSDVINRIARSLLPKGLLHVGMHSGTETRRDSLGRLYCHQDFEEFRRTLEAAGFSNITVSKSAGVGFDGTKAEHMFLDAVWTG